MKKNLIALMIAGFFIAPAMAEKPGWAGKGKPTKEQLEAHQESIKARGDVEALDEKVKGKKDKLKEKVKENKGKKDSAKEEIKPKKEKTDVRDEVGELDDDKLKGLEKQQDKKSEQVRKEMDKGSEKGQESRETSKKWWKIWE